jgi:threonine dehydrogenase-like Zn-dependent dehydrogenase
LVESSNPSPARSFNVRRLLVKASMQFKTDTEVAELGDGGYLVRVDVCGLCRSDLSAAADWAAEWEEPGHEFGGTVIGAPAGGRFRIGQRVAVRNASACGLCDACAAGLPRDCRKLVVNKQGYRDYAVCDERSLVAADGLDDDLLSLVEPVNVAFDLVTEARIADDDRVLVVGSGPLGLIASRLASSGTSGRAPVLVGRRPLPAGFDDVSFLLGADAGRRAFDRLLGGPPTVVLVTAPPASLPQALDWCGRGGRVLTVGLDRVEKCTTTISVWDLVFKRLELSGVFAVPNMHFERAVAFLRARGDSVRRLVTRRVSFEDLAAHFADWNAGRVPAGKTILVNPPARKPCTAASLGSISGGRRI